MPPVPSLPCVVAQGCRQGNTSLGGVTLVPQGLWALVEGISGDPDSWRLRVSLGDAEVMDAKLSSLLGYQSRSASSLLLCLFFLFLFFLLMMEMFPSGSVWLAQFRGEDPDLG